MGNTLSDLYRHRHGKYVKDSAGENFLLDMNKALQAVEQKNYKEYGIERPFIFVFGLPRSGTTLITQLIAHSLNIGFINNFTARFWLAPIHAIKLYRIIYGDKKFTNYHSDFAATSELSDIHEFGYFWRFWLKKESFKGVTNYKEVESDIDWAGLKLTLANMEHEFGTGMIFKNIFGSYHLQKLYETLEKVVYVYIKRDILDSAVSILNARKKYYEDLNIWWSYMPPEFEKIKDLDYWHQIAGQVYYLKRFYDSETAPDRLNNVVHINYEEMTNNPQHVLEKINIKSQELYNYNFEIIKQPPVSFPFRSYNDNLPEKQKFEQLIKEFENEE